MSDSVRPHRRQPTRPPHPWDSPGKNTGVGCHFLLHCMKVKIESEVVQSCLTLCNPIDCSLPGSPVHGIFQARVLEWGAIAFSGSYLIKAIFSFISSLTVLVLSQFCDYQVSVSRIYQALLFVVMFWNSGGGRKVEIETGEEKNGNSWQRTLLIIHPIKKQRKYSINLEVLSILWEKNANTWKYPLTCLNLLFTLKFDSM